MFLWAHVSNGALGSSLGGAPRTWGGYLFESPLRRFEKREAIPALLNVFARALNVSYLFYVG